MGILDDAIREHLDLTRQRGAGEDDLKRLEDEAFGPPVRPGEPEFGEAEAGAASALGGEPETAPDDAGPRTDDWVDAPLEGRRGRSGDDLEDLLAGAGAAPLSIEEPPSAPEPAPEETQAERARREHPDLGDTAPHHPVLDEETGEAGLPREVIPPASESGAGASSAERAPEVEEPPPPAAEPSGEGGEDAGIFDYESGGELDVGELGLDLDDELESEPPRAPPPRRAPEPEPASREPEPRAAEPDRVAEPEPRAAEPDRAAEPEPRAAERPEGREGEEPPADGDLLEETPEFLRDAPESDRLWFEQGEPQDFDFDDE
jgi:hypothetical protein